jgi:predicted transcriptional regulator
MGDNYMKVYNNHTRTKEFLQFMETSRFSTYMFLRGAIIRGSAYIDYGKKINTESSRIYNDYFKKGKLVSHYSIKDMAEFCGKNKSSISRRIADLEKDGFIRIHKRNTPKGISYDYELGGHTGVYGKDSYEEWYYMDNHFSKIYDKQRCIREDAKWEKDAIKTKEKIKERIVKEYKTIRGIAKTCEDAD